jgi:hypothetical protein
VDHEGKTRPFFHNYLTTLLFKSFLKTGCVFLSKVFYVAARTRLDRYIYKFKKQGKNMSDPVTDQGHTISFISCKECISFRVCIKRINYDNMRKQLDTYTKTTVLSTVDDWLYSQAAHCTDYFKDPRVKPPKDQSSGK